MEPQIISSSDTAAFQSEAAFEIRLPARGGVRKSATLRLPTDVEWAGRQRAIKTVQHRLGPGQTQTETEGVEAADAALLRRLLVDEDGEYLDAKGPAGTRDPFDEDEAAELIHRLTKAEVDADPAHSGDSITVSLSVLGGVITAHELRVPTLKQLRKHRKGSFSFVDLRRGRMQMKVNVDEFCRFYDELSATTQGYEGRVPAPHKMAVVSEVLAVLDEIEGEDDPKR